MEGSSTVVNNFRYNLNTFGGINQKKREVMHNKKILQALNPK